jgi:hypothetical protein
MGSDTHPAQHLGHTLLNLLLSIQNGVAEENFHEPIVILIFTECLIDSGKLDP